MEMKYSEASNNLQFVPREVLSFTTNLEQSKQGSCVTFPKSQVLLFFLSTSESFGIYNTTVCTTSHLKALFKCQSCNKESDEESSPARLTRMGVLHDAAASCVISLLFCLTGWLTRNALLEAEVLALSVSSSSHLSTQSLIQVGISEILKVSDWAMKIYQVLNKTLSLWFGLCRCFLSGFIFFFFF